MHISKYVAFHRNFESTIKSKPHIVIKSIYNVFSKKAKFFIKVSQKVDLNLSKYVEFYGDQESWVQMSPNIAFYQFKNYVFILISELKIKGPGEFSLNPIKIFVRPFNWKMIKHGRAKKNVCLSLFICSVFVVAFSLKHTDLI